MDDNNRKDTMNFDREHLDSNDQKEPFSSSPPFNSLETPPDSNGPEKNLERVNETNTDPFSGESINKTDYNSENTNRAGENFDKGFEEKHSENQVKSQSGNVHWDMDGDKQEPTVAQSTDGIHLSQTDSDGKTQEHKVEPKEIPFNLAESKDTQKRVKRERKPFWQTFLIGVLSACVGSLMTIGILYYGGLLEFANDGGANGGIPDGAYEASGNQTYIPSVFKGTSSGTIADIAEELAPAIVGVVKIQQIQQGFFSRNQNVESGYGSGVIFDKDKDYAYIITNNHVIEGAHEVEVSLYDGERTKAEVVGADALTDLAVLKIDAKLADKVATFGDSSKLRPGDEVIAIGNPLGLEFARTVTQGIISAINRNVKVSTSAGEWELTVLQTDAAINPGNSGGALINSRGEVIGINSLKISQEGVEGLGFAIPSNDVVPIAKELIENGQIKRPYLGVLMADLTDIAQFYRQSLFGSLSKGVVITEVEKGSPADKAGLQAADVIVSIEGKEVETVNEFKQYLYKNIKPGDKVTIEFYRDGKKQKTDIVTGGN